MATGTTGDKSEAPTQSRLERSRARGEVARSRDLTSAAVTVAVLGVLSATGGRWFSELVILVRDGVRQATAPTGNESFETVARRTLSDNLHAAVWILGVPSATAVLVALVVGGLQTRGLFVFPRVGSGAETFAPDLGRVFSWRSFGRIGKSFVVVAVLGAVAAFSLRSMLPAFVGLTGENVWSIARALGGFAERLGVLLVGMALCAGVADYLFQRWRHAQMLRMTRAELQRERKESEGDPRHKAERGRVYREMG